MKYETLLVEKSGDLMTVTINRPKILNALNKQTLLEIKELLATLRSDTQTRFVIFTGAGKGFSSGIEYSMQSMQEHYDAGLPNERVWQLFGQDFMQAMESLEQITIAAVNGVSVGAGMCIAMNCDFRILSERAIFSIPETALGIFFTWGATPRLTCLIGPAKAKEMIMTCDPVDAQEALRIGLANKVVAHEQLMPSCLELVQKIRAKGPMAIRICTKQVNAASLSKLADLYPLEPELMEFIMACGQPEEGGRAFMEKRTPQFKDPQTNFKL